MNGEIAQLVALTCHGNAVLRGMALPPFFPNHSTCRFAEYVRFRDAESGVELAATPDLWFEGLRERAARGLLLRQAVSTGAEAGDRMTAGFVGGGVMWVIEAVTVSGTRDFWLSEWDTCDQEAPDDRIWQVDYFRHNGGLVVAPDIRSVPAVRADFETALHNIRAFSARHAGNEGFTSCFDSGLEALKSTDPGYRGDLCPRRTLSQEAQELLSAASVAWVFGGMGSWNDQGFFDDEQVEYERVWNALYSIINEAIAVAASSSWPESGIVD